MCSNHVRIDKKVEIFIKQDSFYFIRRSTGIFAPSLSCYLSKEKVSYQDLLRIKTLRVVGDVFGSRNQIKDLHSSKRAWSENLWIG